MAKKVKGKQDYQPSALLDGESSGTDLEIARKYAKIQASLPEGSTSYRQNVGYRGLLTDKYGALENDFLTPKMAIRLAQMVYHRFGLVRHALDTMAEFTVTGIDFLSKKKASRDIMLGWAEGVDLKGFLDQVALEYYRSGNVYIYRFESNIKDSAIRDLSKIFGLKLNASVKIPTRYTIIDPLLVHFISGSLFSNPFYRIVIPASEVAQMLQHYKNNPSGLNDLPEEFRVAVEQYIGGKGRAADLVIELKSENIIVIHRKKQPYEPYAMPFLTGTFDDLEFRQELRNMDKAVARVVSRSLIHVAVGDDEHLPSAQALDAIRNKLSQPSTSVYLVTDGLVKITQHFPDIEKMLDPKKYDAVKADIQTALGVSTAAYGDGNGSFSNNFLGIKVFIERILDGRGKILRCFLIPEAARVAKIFNLKSPVVPELIGADLNNRLEWAKIYTRLYEDGVLSPRSVIECIRDERFPTYDEEVDRQTEAMDLIDQGMFSPVVNRGGTSQDSGRPDGATTQTTQKTAKKTTPTGSNAVVIRNFSTEEYEMAFEMASKKVKETLGVKKMNADQKGVIDAVCKEFLLTNSFDEGKYLTFLDKVLAVHGIKNN